MSIISDFVQSNLKKVPEIKPGFTVRVHEKIKEEDKERIQVFEGLVIKVGTGKTGIDKTFTVRKIVGGVGVEKVFPLHSPLIKKIEVVKVAKVRRSKLYYMRDRRGKEARLKEVYVSGKEFEVPEEEAPKKAKEEKVESAKTEEAPVEKKEEPTEKVEKAEAKEEKKVEIKEEKAEVKKEEKVEKAEVKEEKKEEKTEEAEAPKEEAK
ncbi:MAG TPA: 50S ribosomal protein L19 [Candidatus Peregrinibacteria bacterium]|nr:50S ribosomal protein L19 [Candidatus Peregrinibacteria bacterium]